MRCWVGWKWRAWQRAAYALGEKRKVERSWIEGRERVVLDGCRRGIVVTNLAIAQVKAESVADI